MSSLKEIAFFKYPCIKKVLLFIYNGYWNIVAHIMSDEEYLKFIYRRRFHRELDFHNPQSFNEKLNWLKLYYHNPAYTELADKYLVKQIVADKIGEKYVVPNYGVWSSFDDIDFNSLPNQFVLKATGDSSGVIICKDKYFFDKKKARKKLKHSLQTNYYYRNREWQYKNIEPKIIADALLDDHTGNELRDYKFWCFNGEPKIMYFTNKGKIIMENFYDMDFNPVHKINHGFPRVHPEFEKPVCFEKMKQLASDLSQGIPFVRIDFFYVNGNIYFGEYTFYDWAGLRPFTNYDVDLEIGKWLRLPSKT